MKLRERALKEKTQAELAWLEQQKKRFRDKGADDQFPQLNKRKRGLLLRLQQEQVMEQRRILMPCSHSAAWSFPTSLLLMCKPSKEPLYSLPTALLTRQPSHHLRLENLTNKKLKTGLCAISILQAPHSAVSCDVVSCATLVCKPSPSGVLNE